MLKHIQTKAAFKKKKLQTQKKIRSKQQKHNKTTGENEDKDNENNTNENGNENNEKSNNNNKNEKNILKNNFIKSMKETPCTICGICPIITPLQSSKCKHLFCYYCLTGNLLNENGRFRCPACYELITKPMPISVPV